MKVPVIAVYDKKTGLFGSPSSCRHIAEAIRQFDTLRKNPENKIGMNPEDFDLFQIAEYDDSLGTMTTLQPHLHLSSGV